MEKDESKKYEEKEDNKLFAILGSNITSTVELLIFLAFNLATALCPAFLPIFEASFKSSKCTAVE